jgi:aspartyl-tRNA(Asn)/glutamyl-tRNA(Gln) amidotransferase subunit B
MSDAKPRYIEGATGPWEVVIGLEVHAQVSSKSKLFSGASTEFGAEPNSQVSLVDAAMPGMLPVINGFCVEQAVRTGLGLKARINRRSVFDRKNYFYPDLPAGYQISQYKQPIVGEGELLIDLADGSSRAIGIERLHLEQDAGKSLHDQHPTLSYIDLNRSGVALMEIVSRPDMRSAEEAGAYLKKLRAILRYLGTCDGNMEEGSMRADVNVSVRRPGGELGTRTETKNVNSIRYVIQAVEHEARRQIGVLEDGGAIVQETRLFDTKNGSTRPMRSKEEAHDYRYFPDPDLLPLELSEAFVEGIAASLPELPDAKKERFVRELGLSPYNAGVFVAEKEAADYFEVFMGEVSQRTKLPLPRVSLDCANLMGTELYGLLNKASKGIEESPISAVQLAGLQELKLDGTLSGPLVKKVLERMFETGRDARDIVEAEGLKQVTDTGAIEAVVDQVMAANPEKLAEIRGGKDKLMGWFVGQVMKAAGGKANPGVVNEILKRKLAG